MTLGVFDPDAAAGNSAELAGSVTRASASGARIIRVQIIWGTVASRRPASPSDPGDPAYSWGAVDKAVDAAVAAGLEPLISFHGAPSWAQASKRPAKYGAGTWKPKLRAVRAFSAALARRYAGRVHDFQLWNEPNLDKYLSPQWVKTAPHRYRAFAPAYYRQMLNAAYTGIKSVDAQNRLITAGTAPYGDPAPGGSRTMPARFWRVVLCLNSRLKKTRCAHPAHFDVLAHHPYAIAGPRRHALNRDDVAVPDMRKLTRILSAARRHGTALPRTRKPLWVTEISWDSSPPDPYGVPAKRHAAWLADALYVLWRQHVSTVLWFRVVDQAPKPSYALTNQSGLYLRNGKPKLAQRAFAFPVACERAGKGRYRVWGMGPVASSSVQVQVRKGRTWKTVGSQRTRADRVFTFVGRGSPVLVRAVQGAATSLGCSPDK